MRAVLELPPREGRLGETAAILVASHARQGEATDMAAQYLFDRLDRRPSNAARLIRALGIGGLGLADPLREKVLDRSETLYRKVAKRDAGMAEKIAQAEKFGIGLVSDPDFTADLHARLGPAFTPKSLWMPNDALRQALGMSRFGQPEVMKLRK